MRYFLQDGSPIYIDREHLDQHRDVLPFLQEALHKVNPEELHLPDVYKFGINMGRIIGKTVCVPTTQFDTIEYAQRVGRDTLTRFVKNREALPCSTVTLLIRKSKKETFHLITAYVGIPAEKESSDKTIKSVEERRKSVEFWNHHALIWGSQKVVRNT